MSSIRQLIFLLITVTLFSSCKKNIVNKQDSVSETVEVLPSWNESTSRTSIINYVTDVTDPSSTNFVPIEDRIAAFDNDGTLWSEQPLYFQFFFALDRIKELANEHPEWKQEEPFRSVLANDLESLEKQGLGGLLKIVTASHAGMNTDEFEALVKLWDETSAHPTKNMRFTQLVYQPMLELLIYLRENEFKTYIVSGGGVDFMRALVTDVYGIPEEQIIGSRIKTEYQYDNGDARIIRLPEIDFVDDKEGKPINIQKIIGKKPIFSAGNSDGDLAMLQWTASNKNKAFMLYVHHTDSIREWAYDRDSHIGRLDIGLDQAIKDGWTLVDMEKDWKVVYPSELNRN